MASPVPADLRSPGRSTTSSMVWRSKPASVPWARRGDNARESSRTKLISNMFKSRGASGRTDHGAEECHTATVPSAERG